MQNAEVQILKSPDRPSGERRDRFTHISPARSIFSNALNFCRSAIAALVRSPWRYCPFRSPAGPPLPLAPPCNRQRPFFVSGDRHRNDATCLRPRGLWRWLRGVARLNAVTKLEQLYFKSLEFPN